MLRISTVDTRSERRLVVEGKLIAPWVDELKRSWGTANQDLDGRRLIVDLSNATTISPEGEEAIRELMNEGARFACCGVHHKYVLKQMMQRCFGPAGRK